MMETLSVNKKIFTYLVERYKAGKFISAVMGGRRSGKTYTISQFLLMQMYNEGDVVNVASMTMEQGRLGAYEDFKANINACSWATYFEVYKSPREIHVLHNGGKCFFNSYSNSETAKGIACDWLFLNEANNFTKQQYTDLVANVRKGVIMDFNPAKFWVDDYIPEDEQLHTTWKDNAKHLTDAQLRYFDDLKRLGDKPDANPVDRRNYLAYYCVLFS
jgi:phage terminase large subunit